jgi:non-ribosomal peptide synthetase component F
MTGGWGKIAAMLPIGDFHRLTAEDCERPVLDLFRQHVAAHPDRSAVIDRGRRISYGELAERARQVAGALHAQGARPQVPVAFLLDHDVDAVAAVLGTMEMGGVALALDPWAPEARSAAILEDATAEVLVTRGAHGAAARRLAGPRRVVDLDAVERSTSPGGPLPRLRPMPSRICSTPRGAPGRPRE